MFWIGVLVGLFFGVFLGLFFCILLTAGSHGDDFIVEALERKNSAKSSNSSNKPKLRILS
jgi:hypothetical protein